MTKLWIGDFRTNSLLAFNNKIDRLINSKDKYLTDDCADYNWFSTVAISQFMPEFADNTVVIVMLGFNDCVQSCIWEKLAVKTAAESYATLLNELAEKYTNVAFYFCTVNPVECDYVTAAHVDGIIAKKSLNDTIKAFNEAFKKKCSASIVIIDSYNYFTTTSFETKDGVRYSVDMCADLNEFITGHIQTDTINSFSPRFSAPLTSGVQEEGAEEVSWFWINSDAGGYNPYAKTSETGSVLPSNAGYAYGRFMEIIGEPPKLVTTLSWWENVADGYARGSEPKLGSIICFSKTNGTGEYVAVVEHVDFENNTIITSESSSTELFFTKVRSNSDNNWAGTEDGLTFKGFIYSYQRNDTINSSSANIYPVSTNVTKAQVVSHATKYLGKSDKKINARYIWNYLGSRGWTLNAVAGLLGNMDKESTLNPGLGEHGGSGFGLVQWTPKSKFTNWLHDNYPGVADDDIDGQLERIIYEAENNKQYSKTAEYNYDFKTFIKSDKTPYELACAFAWNYEKSGVVLWGFHSEKHNKNYHNQKDIGCRKCYEDVHGEAATKRQAEINRQALRDARGGAAEEWYKFLLEYTPNGTTDIQNFTPATRLKIANLKIDRLLPIAVYVSFFATGSNKYSYILTNKKTNKEVFSNTCEIALDTKVPVVTFNISDLIPNTKYWLTACIEGNTTTETRKSTLEFITPQSFPKSADNINLKLLAAMKNDCIFKLTATLPTDWGYWGDKSTRGYELSLMINGNAVCTKQLTGTINLSDFEFDLKNTFGYNGYTTTDSVQLGIRTWVTDDFGNKIFDNDFPKVSNPVCLLKKPCLIYLNPK